ncbi:helix-turn-helix domain-containing protein [Actinomadura parmotrematis]|uniref:Helix-turn-helix transcriptional regulator n=1 Tax=Actinomadura parmotrematis TaxID=2864039 RepID=A0ABS7FRW7_9ACTN|nr:helix-turn-helix transcriptional regulator [Actinomadura parmotrematis]MBW8483056.1 helix-turn-helix transcriptional regulator [Actinomadura parmotrematis]
MVRPSPEPTESIYALMAYALRLFREKHGLTQTQVGEIMGCSVSQVSKHEAGTAPLDDRDCQRLENAWDLGKLFSAMSHYAKLGADPDWYRRLLHFHRTATQHRIFQNNLIPIPCQTEAYARCLLEAGWAAGHVEDVDAAVERRMEHQRKILANDPQIWLVLDQPALRTMGSRDIMAEQLDRLLELMTPPTSFSFRMIPDASAPHIGVDGSFSVFELPSRMLVGFAGTVFEIGRVIEDQSEAAAVFLRFERLAARAWSEDQSRDFIVQMRGSL